MNRRCQPLSVTGDFNDKTIGMSEDRILLGCHSLQITTKRHGREDRRLGI